MSHDDYITRTPDDDPWGEAEVYGPCRDCGAPEGEPCALDCGCRACRRSELADAERALREPEEVA